VCVEFRREEAGLPVEKGFGGRGTGKISKFLYVCVAQRLDSPSWNIDVDWYDSVTSSDNRVGVVVVSTSANISFCRLASFENLPVGTRTHRDDPSWLGHLIVDYFVSMLRSTELGEGPAKFHAPFLKAGAILFVKVPATIMISLCRGLARKTTPNRS
jgi:hypothetical protein